MGITTKYIPAVKITKVTPDLVNLGYELQLFAEETGQDYLSSKDVHDISESIAVFRRSKLEGSNNEKFMIIFNLEILENKHDLVKFKYLNVASKEIEDTIYKQTVTEQLNANAVIRTANKLAGYSDYLY